jgi:hypothetical protein
MHFGDTYIPPAEWQMNTYLKYKYKITNYQWSGYAPTWKPKLKMNECLETNIT